MNKKKLYVEVLRIIAIIFVVFNHTGIDGYWYFAEASNSLTFTITFIISSLCKVAVPIFFMISGSLLLGKDEKITIVLKHRVLKYGISLAVASLCYYIYEIACGEREAFKLDEIFKIVYSKPIAGPYWYLYSFIGLMLMLPFLRILAQNMKKEYYYYLISLYILMKEALPNFWFFHGEYKLNVEVLFLSSNVFFFFVGYGIEKYWTEFANKKNIVILNIVGFGELILNVLMESYNIELYKNYDTEQFVTGFLLGVVIMVYVDIKYFSSKIHFIPQVELIILEIGKCTFGVYLMESFLRSEFIGVFDFLRDRINPYIGSWIWVIFIVGVGIILTSILRKIPIVNKII